MSSTPVSSLTSWVLLPTGESVWCEDVMLTLDEGWSPHVQATVVIPWTPERAAALDPRTWCRATLGLRRSWTGRLTLEDLSDQWAGLTLADLSTAWAGLTLDDLTTAWTTPWESGTRAEDETACDLAVRTRDVDYAAGTITLTLASDELLAQGVRIITARPAESLAARVLALLSAASVPVVASDLSAGAAVMLDAATYDVTTTVWQSLEDAATGAGLRLWCDHTRTWRLSDPMAAPTSTLTITRARAGRDSTDLDREFADVLIWRGTAEGRTTDGTTETWVPVTETVIYPNPVPAGPHVMALWEQDFGRLDVASIPVGFIPTSAALAARLARLSSRGRTADLTAIADPLARPGQQITTGAPSLPSLVGVAAAITLDLPGDTMTITTRSAVAGA